MFFLCSEIAYEGAMDWGLKVRVVFLIGAGAALALALAGCEAGPRATAGKGPPAAASVTPAGQASAPSADPRDQPAPLASDGKPVWAANRRHTAQENADYQFGKNGKDFGAATETDYVLKAHAFLASPPAGVQRVERGNGDTLLYDPKTNTFAVATSAGVPRTMFKPRDGASYWREQVAKVNADNRGDDNSQG